MSIEENVQVVKDFFAAMGGGDPSLSPTGSECNCPLDWRGYRSF
jgi:hypothetical protein